MEEQEHMQGIQPLIVQVEKRGKDHKRKILKKFLQVHDFFTTFFTQIAAFFNINVSAELRAAVVWSMIFYDLVQSACLLEKIFEIGFQYFLFDPEFWSNQNHFPPYLWFQEQRHVDIIFR